ncbi:hypothetical protein JKF63_07500 [Porcisia hertigi]|uniref:Integral membrane bound transporter domain-containing protein n=1 Tax=Porcisia hertigi TaxID=2761500 RepID=A0A836LH97_9TRYP|nr:hypothetical protein JKF63_07500 [Porcisia hertigi]
MSSHERNPVGTSGPGSPAVTGGHEPTPLEVHHPQETSNFSDTSNRGVRFDNEHHGVLPTGAAQMGVTNDSFGYPLGSHAVFGTTRPFDGQQSSLAVEEFLSGVPPSNTTTTQEHHLNPNSGIVAGSMHLGDRANRVSPPREGASSAAPPIVVPAPRHVVLSPTGNLPRKSAVLTENASSSTASVPIVASFTSLAASSRPPLLPRSPSGRSPISAFPLFSSVAVSGAASSTMPPSAAQPASPLFGNASQQGSSHTSHLHASEATPGGLKADLGVVRPYGSPQRSLSNPGTPPTSRRAHYGGGMQFAVDSMPVQGGIGSGLPRSRSDAELCRLFSEREGANPSPTIMTATGQVLRGGSPGGFDRPVPYVTASTLSSTSRPRGVVQALEPSANTGGAHNATRYGSSSGTGSSNNAPAKPRWMSAVERIKDSRSLQSLSLYDPVLPYDQSKLGLQTRRVAAQGALTASKLEALVAQQAGGVHGGTDHGYPPQLLCARSVKSASTRHSSHPARYPVTSHAMPVLVAHEEALVASTRHHGSAASEQSANRRSGAVRSVASGGQGPAGGRSTMTVSPNSRVITALETVTGGGFGNTNTSTPGGASSRHRGSGGGVLNSLGTVVPKLSPVGYKHANVFPGKPYPAATCSLFATDSAEFGVVGTSTGNSGGAAGTPQNTDGQKGVAPGAGGGGGGDGGGRGGGGSGGGMSGSPKSQGEPHRSAKVSRSEVERNHTYKSKDIKKQMDTEGDEDERDERHFRTRNIDALHAIPWDQRRQLPMNGFGTRFFALLSTPRFWEKLDWTVRGSFLTVLPTMVLSLEPSTSHKFPMPSTLAFNAFWITMPTFGAGLRELAIALKGFSFGLLFLCIIVGTQPGPAWLTLLLLFFFTLVSSFVAEETKKTAAYVLASTIMQYITNPTETNYHYVGQYYIGLLIALAFGMVSFLVPFIRWSSDIARHYIKAMGNALSIDLQGTLSSFWVRTPLERELNVVHLRQLRATAERCVSKIEQALDEASYEPHSGAYMTCMVNRFNFCKSIHNILGSLSHVIELVAENPSLIDTPMCTAFGEQIGDHLAIITSAMDSMVLKIVDFERIVTPQETQFFREARERFQEALSRVREDVILTNENYETDESDVLLGFFMFSLDEMCEVISQFEDTAHAPSSLWNAMMFPLRDLKSVIAAFRYLILTIGTRRTIPRRMKESIKLSLCIVLPSIFQVYTLDNNAVSPMAGAAVIALIYNRTGSESFHYASGRLLGTVLGSMGALLSVQFANGRLWVLYIFIALLSFIGGYVQAAPGFYALGNAIVSSTISICTQYHNQNAAMVRIQQNCFAILMYFAIACFLWPMRARTKVSMSLNVTLRCMREATTLLLRNLDMPPDASEVTADVSALLLEMNKKVRAQSRFIPGAVEEPTMDSAGYPEDSWKSIVEAEKKICSALSMMCFAYNTFMSSRADSTTELSVHWVLLHRIAPHAQDLSDLIYASIDLYLLSLSKMTIVPTSHMARLRAGMVDAHKAILNTYISTVSRKVAGEDDTADRGVDDELYSGSSYVNDHGYLDHSDYGYGGGGHGGVGGGGGGGSNSTPYLPPTTGARSYTENAGDLSPSRPQGSSGAAGGADDNASGGGCHNSGPNGRRAEGAKSEEVADATASPQLRPQRRRGGRLGHAHHDGNHSSRSSSHSSSSGNDGPDDNGNARRYKKSVKGGDSKKKMGYLGYDLTSEEAATLRAVVANRVGSTAAGGKKSMVVDNNTFSGRFSAAAAATAAVAARSSAAFGVSPPQANNDTRLMAIVGGDEGLAATLRKKHKVVVRRGKEAENGGDAEESGSEELPDGDRAKGDRHHLDNTNEAAFPNASFLNSSFIKNASFLSGLFSKKAKEQRDLDAMEMSKSCARRSHGLGELPSATARLQKDAKTKGQRQRRADKQLGDDDDENVSQHRTSITSPTRHPAGGSVESEFSDIEDDSKSRNPTHSSTRVRGVGRGGAVEGPNNPKMDGCPPMAQSMPAALSGRKSLARNLLGEGGGNALEGAAGESENTPSMAQSVPQFSLRNSVMEPSEVSGKKDMVEEKLQRSGIPTASAASGAKIFDVLNGDGSTTLAPSVDIDIASTTLAHPAPESSEVVQPTSQGVTGDDEHPQLRSRSGAGERQPHDSSDVILTKDGGTPGNTETGVRDASGAVGVENEVLVDDAATVRRVITPVFSNLSSGMCHRSLHQSDARERASSFKKLSDGDATSRTPSSDDDDEGEILKHLSFFDADKGGFVLTNHDIHSLEAFLFGTQAIIVHMNELQKALLEMHHATDLAKRL